MVDVKPDEISAILQEQLSNYKTDAELEEIGTVLQIGDGIARVYGLTKVKAGELVEFEDGTKAIALNLEEDNVGVVLMDSSDDIKEGDTVNPRASSAVELHCRLWSTSVSSARSAHTLAPKSSGGLRCTSPDSATR